MKIKTTLKFFIVATLLILNVAKTNAQIVYTDIDPDATIYKPNVQYYDSIITYPFDLNLDNIIEFYFLARHYFSSGQQGTFLTVNRRFVTCNSCKVSGGCTSFDERNDIFFNDTININLIWGNDASIYSTIIYCALPVGDIYFGLKLVIDTDTFYGWVRCTATDTSITVKDYAYNSTPEMYILAGQTILGNDSLTLSNNINIFQSNNMLHINLSNAIQAQGYIRMFNSTGILLKTVIISGLTNSISLTGISSGIYIIQVETPSAILNKQIFLQGN